jgi:hypothetical protein
MRQFLAVLVVSAAVPLAALSAAGASDRVDHEPYTVVETSESAPSTDSGSGVVAGPDSAQNFGPYFEQRLDNMGQ